MPDKIQPENEPNVPSGRPNVDNDELSEQELNDVNGGGAQPQMRPPGPPIVPIVIHGIGQQGG